MQAVFNANEVFEMAEQIERDGADFYRDAATNAQDASVRALFHRLALLEQDHERTFARLRERLVGPARHEDWTDGDEDAMAYLRALASNRVFDREKAQLTGQETSEQVLRIAIGFEKESIAFYLGIKELMPDDLGKNEVDALVREEMRHVTMLTEALPKG
jgi:rubrerythrin